MQPKSSREEYTGFSPKSKSRRYTDDANSKPGENTNRKS